MSFFATIGVKITDLDIFKTACEDLNVRFEEQSGAYYIIDNVTGRRDTLQPQSDGSFQVYTDTDKRYNRAMNRLGNGYENLFRQYSRNQAIQIAEANGYTLISEEQCEDQGILLRVAV